MNNYSNSGSIILYGIHEKHFKMEFIYKPVFEIQTQFDLFLNPSIILIYTRFYKIQMVKTQ